MDAPQRGSRRAALPLIAFLVGVPLAIGIGAAWFRLRVVPLFACANEVVAEEIAPGGAHRAVVFQRNCGATTPFSTHVSVLPASEPLPNAAGNALVLRDRHEVALAWTDATHLAIDHPRGAERFVAAPEIDGVFVELPPR